MNVPLVDILHIAQGCEGCGKPVVVTVRFEQLDGLEDHRHLCSGCAQRFRVRGWRGPIIHALDTVAHGFDYDLHGDREARP